MSGTERLRDLIAASRNLVVFTADLNTEYERELYLVSIIGGEKIKLNGSLPSSIAYIVGFQISSDGKRVVYRVEDDAQRELYVVFDGFMQMLPMVSK